MPPFLCRYERVWDPEQAQNMGRLDFVHQRVAPNKREFAYPLLHARGYHLPGFFREVDQVCVRLTSVTFVIKR